MKPKYRIIAAALAALCLLHPLSAHAESGGTFVWERDAWYFSNHAFYFHDAFRDNLLPEHEALLKERLNNVEYTFASEVLEMEQFYGYCYGMAATSMLACFDLWEPDAHMEELGTWHTEGVTGDLYSLRRMTKFHDKPNTTYYEQSLIAYYMTLQLNETVLQECLRRRGWTDAEKLAFLADKGTRQEPVLLFYDRGRETPDQYFGHVVLAYGVESGSWEWDGKAYDARILIYDSNNLYETLSPDDRALVTQETQLYYNTQSFAWTVPYYHFSSEDGTLYGLIDDVGVVGHKGLLEGTAYTPSPWLDVILTNMPHSACKVTGEADSDVQAYDFCVNLAEDDQCRNFINEAASTAYTVSTEQPQELLCSTFYEKLHLLGKTADGTEVNFDPSGAVSVRGNAADYRLRLIANEAYPTSYYYVDVCGTAGEASLSMAEEGYLLTADDLSRLEVTVQDRDRSYTLTASADAGTVLIHESGNLPVISADLDRDGVYETRLTDPPLTLGDLNGDGEPNASDAAQILIAAAKIGAGSASGLTPAQEQAADVDGNGEINAADAALILMYAAEAGSGNVSGTLEDYLEVRT